ncbi:hypothetical protein EJ04DRAFT_441266 [Polyplosphaeria fusca]|uniref:Sulfotransferase n=1 Tax=Polyplosphaeria fusca TaxID=682080 RepID=A0A9P4QR82_9PLEO|nr:hypothetical protein EJ04DRAFT_441266 [Polyplosphaeria fusca]
MGDHGSVKYEVHASDHVVPSKAVYNVLFTQPRTCSHLLLRILNLPQQPSIYAHPSSGYFFISAMQKRFSDGRIGKYITEWTEEQKVDFRDSMNQSAERVENWIKEVQNAGKGTIFKEHTSWFIDSAWEEKFLRGLHNAEEVDWSSISNNESVGRDTTRTAGNETVLSDDTLKKLRPTFLIRHPALAFPSLAKSSIDVINSADAQFFSLTYHWSRRLYEWYSANLSEEQKQTNREDLQSPIILDADDILEPALVRKYADAIGLDTSALRFEWEVATQGELEKASGLARRMKSTLFASTSVEKGKSSEGVNIEAETKKWVEEYGQEIADRLAYLVEKAMPDFEWLKERRMRVPKVDEQGPASYAMNYSS